VFDHVTISVSDRVATERFYATLLPVIGKERTSEGEYDDFSFALRRPATRGLHVAFSVPSTEIVDAFWQVGTSAGFQDDGAPGPRPEYGPDYYGAFLLDPDGNSIEAVSNDADRTPGAIDHLWLRSRDLAAAKAFYETIGFELGDDTPDRVQFVTERASFSFVTGDRPTENVHMAWPAETNEQVDAFHAAAVEAGYKSNGAPGERAVYHPGYYAAFVFDPDGHNVEIVNHNR
jgi:catechol 2,3-dioxygenase-like lactoylglutathione lyase family enzyme